ncbi:thioredoxin family protein [Flaviflexus huanghaiensis]|uniref:thioredoxin family protein n=1 Tax=Flaviflexus huanghaiensis TaxID=1111473 RepID=UPI0015FAF40B|nr:thioredoxin family protein [Flaviflexus huanghaiensis]
MHIKVLGPGCKNCVNLEKNARAAITDMNIDAEITKVTDYAEIAAYGVMSTPGLVVDEHVLVSGRVPKPAEIKTLLANLT